MNEPRMAPGRIDARAARDPGGAPAARAASDFPPGIPGFDFADLRRPERLAALHRRFGEEAAAEDPELWAEWSAYSSAPEAADDPVRTSALLVRMSARVSRFLARLFGIEAECEALARSVQDEGAIHRFKSEFIKKRVLPLLKNETRAAPAVGQEGLVESLLEATGIDDREQALAAAGCRLMDQEAKFRARPDDPGRAEVAERLEALAAWCAARIADPGFRSWTVFRFPRRLDYANLVETACGDAPLSGALEAPTGASRRRDGFTLTDPRMREREVQGELHYCLICHERDRDSCSKGIRGRDGIASVNPLGVRLEGCPLAEKISEMHALQRQGDAIGALALILIDNPMCPGTGHRICNDCMKSCIFQRQEPVNIPQAETRVLIDVLGLPWGVEVYDLLARWNPLNVHRPYALPYNGINVLVVGMGPAGYTLAHRLLNEGFGVAGIDGLKLEPIPAELAGGDGRAPRPVRSWSELHRPPEQRASRGFGGVSEYGITAHWDKNFLTLIQLSLARHSRMRIHGGVRFGGTLTLEDAWALGFHHAAIAAGAGRPAVIDIRNNFIRGIRMASDFLMALQLTGAWKRDGLANLQVKLPAVVIGGGLTAIDAATELLAYYPVQVEKILERYEVLSRELGEERVRGRFDPEELQDLDEFLVHGRAVRSERERARRAGEEPDLPALAWSWGGVSIVYRKRLIDSPAYRHNHAVLQMALEEGITFIENLAPEEAVPDDRGRVRAVRFRRRVAGNGSARTGGDAVELPARAVLIAAGTKPNIAYERERPGTFLLDATGDHFLPHAAERGADGSLRLEPDAGGLFTSYSRDGRLVSFIGDNHPKYAGSVVRAMASAREACSRIAALFAPEIGALDPARQAERDRAWEEFAGRLDRELAPRLVKVERAAPGIVELTVRAPAAARRFRPGQFFRFQNYESHAPVVFRDGRAVPLILEGIALTGTAVDPERGLVSLLVLEAGASSRLCARLRPDEPVVLMGPTGSPAEIPAGKNVLLAGGGFGNAVLLPIARAMRERGNRVLAFAGFERGEELFRRAELESAAGQVVWCTAGGAAIEPARPQDRHFRGGIVEALAAFARGELGDPEIPLDSVDRIVAIGPARMLAALRQARRGVLAPHLRPDHAAIAGVNSPMLCMIKAVCAHCLLRCVDPESGEESFAFACDRQEQPMDRVDFDHLAARLRQNSLQEKLANLWLDHLLAGADLPGV